MMNAVCFLEEKRVQIISPAWYYDQGIDVPQTTYFDEVYTTDERAAELLSLANEQYETGQYILAKIPQIRIYYKKVETVARTATFTLPNGEVLTYSKEG